MFYFIFLSVELLPLLSPPLQRFPPFHQFLSKDVRRCFLSDFPYLLLRDRSIIPIYHPSEGRDFSLLLPLAIPRHGAWFATSLPPPALLHQRGCAALFRTIPHRGAAPPAAPRSSPPDPAPAASLSSPPNRAQHTPRSSQSAQPPHPLTVHQMPLKACPILLSSHSLSLSPARPHSKSLLTLHSPHHFTQCSPPPPSPHSSHLSPTGARSMPASSLHGPSPVQPVPAQRPSPYLSLPGRTRHPSQPLTTHTLSLSGPLLCHPLTTHPAAPPDSHPLTSAHIPLATSLSKHTICNHTLRQALVPQPIGAQNAAVVSRLFCLQLLSFPASSSAPFPPEAAGPGSSQGHAPRPVVATHPLTKRAPGTAGCGGLISFISVFACFDSPIKVKCSF